MRIEAAALLLDIRGACQNLAELTFGKTYLQYNEEKFTRAAAERFLLIIGEAVSRMYRVDRDLAESLPASAQIIAFRNRLVHGYDDVNQ